MSWSLSLKYRAFIKTYPWRRIDPVPCAVLKKPVSRCRVALVSSAGLVVAGDEPFDQEVKGGDFSYRLIPEDAPVQQLEEHHRSAAFDHSGVEADRNLALPLDRLREMAAAGEVGAVAPRHVSLMGSISAPGRLRKITAPAVAKQLLSDGVDLALLIPV